MRVEGFKSQGWLIDNLYQAPTLAIRTHDPMLVAISQLKMLVLILFSRRSGMLLTLVYASKRV